MTDNHEDRRFPSVAITRLALLVAVPLAVVLGIKAVAWAVNLKTWTGGETLTAADLNANFAAVNAQLVAQPPCRTGFWSLADGRICMKDTLQAAGTVYGATGAIKTCESIGSHVCTFTEFRQACANSYNPYGVTTGWYGDHGVVTSTSNLAAMGNWDDEFGTWNAIDCTTTGNNDGPAIDVVADTATTHQYRCCY